MTARTPSRFGPLAAQSRDAPDPYALPAVPISGVAEHDEAAGALDVLDGLRLARHALEVGREPDVGGLRIPGEELALGDRQLAPGLVSGEDVGVRLREHLAANRGGDHLVDLGRA